MGTNAGAMTRRLPLVVVSLLLTLGVLGMHGGPAVPAQAHELGGSVRAVAVTGSPMAAGGQSADRPLAPLPAPHDVHQSCVSDAARTGPVPARPGSSLAPGSFPANERGPGLTRPLLSSADRCPPAPDLLELCISRT